MADRIRTLTVIGGGPAGVQAALSAAPHLEQVRLVASGPPGDWSKLLPSRVWLAAVDEISRASCSPFIEALGVDLGKLSDEVDRVSRSWRDRVRKELSEAGVEVVIGRATFRSRTELIVTDGSKDLTVETDATIIASGAEPAFPPGLEPDGEQVFSAATVSQMAAIPESIIVIGDGCIGFEFVDVFSRLGVNVRWIVLEGGPRSGFALEIDDQLLAAFRERGVEFLPGAPVSLERGPSVAVVRPDGSRFEADAAFVNIGHRPRISSLELAAAGLTTADNGALQVDEYFRTRAEGIYAVGDALRFWTGNVAMGEARCAALHAARVPVAPFDHDTTIIAFGYNPQVAKVGSWDVDEPSVRSGVVSYESCLMAHVERQMDGFVRVAWTEDERILGAHAGCGGGGRSCSGCYGNEARRHRCGSCLHVVWAPLLCGIGEPSRSVDW